MDEGSNSKWEPTPEDDDPLKPMRTLVDLEADVSAAVIRVCDFSSPSRTRPSRVIHKTDKRMSRTAN